MCIEKKIVCVLPTFKNMPQRYAKLNYYFIFYKVYLSISFKYTCILCINLRRKDKINLMRIVLYTSI